MKETIICPDAFKEMTERSLEQNINRIKSYSGIGSNFTSELLVQPPMKSLRDIDEKIPFYHANNISNAILTETGLGFRPMSRSRIQVIMRHTPGSTYEYQGGHVIVSTINIKGTSNVNETNIIRTDILAMRLIHDFNHARNMNSITHGRSDNQAILRVAQKLKIVRPDSVYVRPFPDVYRCTNCKHIYRVDTRNGSTRCPRNGCGGEGVQLRHVNIHNCGNIEAIRIPECRDHGRKYILLDDKPQEPQNWVFKCGICNKQIQKGTYSECSYCGDSSKMQTVVHNKTIAYVPLINSFVNLKQGNYIDKVISNPENYLLSSHNYNECPNIDPGRIEEIKSILNKIIRNGWDNDRAKRFIEDCILRPEEKAINIWNIIDSGKYKSNSSYDQAISNIKTIFDDKASMIETALDKLETENAINNPSKVSLNELAKRNHGKYFEAIDLANKLGIKDIIYVENIPMAITNSGYRRLTRNDINRYDSPIIMYTPDSDDKLPVYAETYETEGFIIQLDERRVSEFVSRWGDISVPENIPTTLYLQARASSHRNIIRECDDKQLSEQKMLDVPGHYTFALLHTISHATILASSTLSGYQTGSLSEHLLPGSLTFIIYSNKYSETSIGGLHAIFDHDPYRFIKRIGSVARDCIHDPSCMNGTDASCPACIQLSETSCRAMNSHLSRKLLYGNKSTKLRGYFNWI